MIIGTIAVTIPKWIRAAVACAVGVFAALFLAIGGSPIQDNLRITTPGALVSHALVPPRPQDLLGDRCKVEEVPCAKNARKLG
jgi:hypothetical protein